MASLARSPGLAAAPACSGQTACTGRECKEDHRGQRESSSKTRSTRAETVPSWASPPGLPWCPPGLLVGGLEGQGGRHIGPRKWWHLTESGNEMQQLPVPSPSHADMLQGDLDPGEEVSLSCRPPGGHVVALETDRGLNPRACLLVLLYFSVRLSTLSLSVLVCKWGR